MASQAPNQPRAYSQAYLPNGAAPQTSGPTPGAVPLQPNQGRVIQAGGARVLCVADVRGHLRSLNDLAVQARADYIIHTGDFGFYDDQSLGTIAEKTLRHVAQYSPLLPENVKLDVSKSTSSFSFKERFQNERLPLSELQQFLNGTYKLDVPVYTVWGACEDVKVLEKLRSGEYKIHNLFVIDEAHARLLEIGGVKLRLLGLGGAVVMHKLFDNGEGRTTIAGGQGTMWTTLLQMGELVDTATRVYDPTETRVFVSHASPAREGLLNQLSVKLKADFSISAGLHFRYGSSYNEFSVNPTLDHYRGKLAASKASFHDVWETVRAEVEPAVSENETQQRLLRNALDVVESMPAVANGGNPFGGQPAGAQAGQIDESAFKNMWNFNLADAAFGWLVLDIDQGRIGTEMKAQGFNFAHRTGKTPHQRPLATSTGPTSAAPAPVPGPGTTSMPPQASRAPSGPAAHAQQQSRTSTGPAQGGHAGAGPQQTRSPAPHATGKAGTPQPAAPATASKPPTTNGAPPLSSASPAPPTPGTPVGEKKPSTAIFLQGVNEPDEVPNLFPESERSKIVKIEKRGTHAVAFFSSTEEMRAVLDKGPNSSYDGKFKGTKFREFIEGGPRAGDGFRGRGGRGGFVGRGGPSGSGVPGSGSPAGSPAAAAAAAASAGNQSASDSEGARGRGGFRGRGGGRSERPGRGGRGRGGGGAPSKGGVDGGNGPPTAGSPAAGGAGGGEGGS